MDKVYTLDDLKKMSQAEIAVVLSKATKISGTAVVKRADGSVKYDAPEKAGEYGEK